VRRYPAYDPPEYLDWRPDPELLRRYRETAGADPHRKEVLSALAPRQLLELYRDLLRTRLLDIQLKRWVRQGVISKAWLGTGEEAVTVGAVHALDPRRDWVCPMIRNAGACHMMGMTLADLLRGYLATPDSPTGGRDLHVGDLTRRVLQPISQMGTNVPVMAGVAMGLRARGERGVALTFIGDGATKTGECHEGLNFAAVRNLPVVYILQDNQVALGTRAEQHGIGRLDRWGRIYGMPTEVVDGNHVLDVRAATGLAVERCRRGRGPALVLARTFRMGGHATHDEREARETFPAELFDEWGRKDPVGLFEAFLRERGSPPELLERIEARVLAEIEAAAEDALASRQTSHDPEAALLPGVSEGPPLVGLQLRPL
jgi:2-oxoisovalerate dehydrogenase E1 component